MIYLIIGLIGLLGGLVGGLFGVGGGIIFVPLLVLLANFDLHLAIGTSLATIVPTGMIGALKHVQNHFVDWKTVALLAIFSVVGAWLGASLSLRLDTAILRRIYALFLAALSLKLFFSK